MAIIRKDKIGLYAKVDGWIARPPTQSGYYLNVNGKSELITEQVTKFKNGDKPIGHHFGGSSRIGIGKLEGKGKFEEYWKTDGLVMEFDKNKK